ncbi:histidinol-phosphatase [soil metagenome]
MAHSYNDDLRLAHVLADNADSQAMEYFLATDLQVSTKADLTLVTEADKAVESSIRKILKSTRTRDTVLGEEEGELEGSLTGTGRRWIIDPIDGTHNYVRGVPVWATLIALEEDGEIVASCVSAPALQRRWWASKGGGAFTGKSLMSSRQIHVSQVSEVADASFSYSSLGGWENIGKLESVLALTRRCWRTRAFGDFWSYMMVAEGTVDIAAEPELNLWDMAALDVIVREAGGVFTGLDGKPGPWGSSAIATNARLHDSTMAYLSHFTDSAEDLADAFNIGEEAESPLSNVHTLHAWRTTSDD